MNTLDAYKNLPESEEYGIANPFRDPVRRRGFRGAVWAFHTKHRDFYIQHKGETIRRGHGTMGSSVAEWFWRGYDKEPHWIERIAKDAGFKMGSGYPLFKAGIIIGERDRKNGTFQLAMKNQYTPNPEMALQR